MGAHRDGRLCYLERRNHAIALALYRAAETTATRALRERAEQRRIRPLIVQRERLLGVMQTPPFTQEEQSADRRADGAETIGEEQRVG
jgi:hypothetical protein